MFKSFVAAAALALPLTVLAADPATPPAAGASKSNANPRTSQQDRMRTCNRDAKERQLKGDERRRFMSGCLKGQPAAAG